MKLDQAEFQFKDHKVVFTGPDIFVYQFTEGVVGDHRWVMVDAIKNNWTGRNREDDGVMCRAYKPRVKDATEILRSTLTAK